MSFSRLLEILGLKKQPKPWEHLIPRNEVSGGSALGDRELAYQRGEPKFSQDEVISNDIPSDEVTQVPEEDWDAELRTKLESATTFAECWEVVDGGSDDGNLVVEALEKALSLAETAEECEDVYQHSDCTMELESKAADKQTSIFMAQLEAVSTTAEALEIEADASQDFNNELDSDAVVRRALSLATDVDDCNLILENREFGEDPQELENAIGRKMISFFTSVDECEGLWNEQGTDTEFGAMAICRAAEIIRAENESGDSDPSTRAASPVE